MSFRLTNIINWLILTVFVSLVHSDLQYGEETLMEEVDTEGKLVSLRATSAYKETSTFRTYPTFAPHFMTLDTKDNITSEWMIESVTSKTYLYYSEDPLNINKSLLNLTNPDDFDLSQFEGVEGVWVFPHKHFFSPPAETLYALFAFSGVRLYENVQINYYAYKGGEVNVFTYEGDTPIATFKGSSMAGWQNESIDLPSGMANFRIEVRAEAEGDLIFIDKIIAGPRREEPTEEPPTSPIISEIPGTKTTFAPIYLTLDRNNHTTDWIIESVTSKTYLYYFEDPLNINKSLLNLPNPHVFDLNQFEGVEGVWVFPHKHFYSPPPETLYALFAYSGFSRLYENVQINYYAYNGGEINVFAYEGECPIATFKGADKAGWQIASINLPKPLSRFRVEVRAEAEGEFVLVDKIIAGPRQEEVTEEPPTSPISDIPGTETTLGPAYLTLDTMLHSTSDWRIESVTSKTYLYYFEGPLKINKSLLNLPKPEDFDLNQFEGVEGVWVFPHKHFFSPPAETLYVLFEYSGFWRLYEHVQINYYAYNGGEINVFTYEGETQIATFKSTDKTGWQSVSINLPSAMSRFRIEVRAETEGDFVLVDKIIAGPRQDEDEPKETPTSPISEIPVTEPSTIGDNSSPSGETEITVTTEATISSTVTSSDTTPLTSPTFSTEKTTETEPSTTEQSTVTESDETVASSSAESGGTTVVTEKSSTETEDVATTEENDGTSSTLQSSSPSVETTPSLG